MGTETYISWCDHTFNAWVGCAKVSPACTSCYAEVGTFARTSRARGVELWGAKAARHVTSVTNWELPHRWDRAAAKAGVRRTVFCSSLSDVFEDRPDIMADSMRRQPSIAHAHVNTVDVLRAARRLLWQTIHETPNLSWLLLTKRIEDADRLAFQAWDDAFGMSTASDCPEGPWLPNIWLGTTVENQEYADKRIPELLKVPAAIRFISVEPLLGPVDLARYLQVPAAIIDEHGQEDPLATHLLGEAIREGRGDGPRALHWVIAGGESGAKPRAMDPAWARSLRDQCSAAGVAFHFKQWGEHNDGLIRLGKKKTGRLLDGREWNDFPQVRQ